MTASRQALLLLAHGSPDPEWAHPMEKLQDMLIERCPGHTVALAFLPPAQPDFAAAVNQLVTAGAEKITVAPAFLGRGNHLKRDLPELAEAAAARHNVAITVLPALGEAPEVMEAMASWIAHRA